MLINLETFQGLVPRKAAKKLGKFQAQIANDCNLLNGDLRAWLQNKFMWTPTKVGAINSLYRYAQAYWFHWTESGVSVVRAPIAGDVTDRVIFTGVATGPKITDNTIAIQGGGTNYPNNAYDLGIPAPTVAPTVVGTPNADPSLNESRIYVETYVSGWGEEGPPSPVSAIVDIDPDVVVNLSLLNVVPAGNYNIISKRIYRSVDSGIDATFMLVAEIPVAQTTYADTVSGVTVASNGGLLSAEWDMPPADLTGIVELPNGSIAGFSGNELCFSVPYQPHAWPVAYRYATNWPIVGIGAFGNSLVIGTAGLPYLAIAGDPSSASVEKLETEQACVSMRGMVDMGTAVAMPTPDGLQMIGMGINKLVTASLMTRKEWQAYNPPSIHAYFHDGRYIAFYDATAIGGVQGGFILDPNNPEAGLTHTTFYATSGFTNREDDYLYLVVGGNVVRWDGGPNPRTYTWRSKTFPSPKPVNPGIAQVKAAAYPITFNLYAYEDVAGVPTAILKHTQAATDSKPFRLPAGYLAEDFEIELVGSSDVSQCIIAESVDELKAV